MKIAERFKSMHFFFLFHSDCCASGVDIGKKYNKAIDDQVHISFRYPIYFNWYDISLKHSIAETI